MNQSNFEPEVIRWIRLKRETWGSLVSLHLFLQLLKRLFPLVSPSMGWFFPGALLGGLWEILSNSGWESLHCLKRPSVRLSDIVSQGGVQQFVWRELILEPDLPGRQSWLCLSGAVRHWAVPSPL